MKFRPSSRFQLPGQFVLLFYKAADHLRADYSRFGIHRSLVEALKTPIQQLTCPDKIAKLSGYGTVG
jgi:hypothetical protein